MAEEDILPPDPLDIKVRMPLRAALSCHASLRRTEGHQYAVHIYQVHLSHV